MGFQNGRSRPGQRRNPLHIANTTASGQDGEPGDRCGDDRFRQREARHQRMDRRRLGPQAGGGIALRIKIDQQCAQAPLGQRGREVGGGRGLPHAPLLIDHAQNPSHAHVPSDRLHPHNRCTRDIGHLRHDRHAVRAAPPEPLPRARSSQSAGWVLPARSDVALGRRHRFARR